MYPVSAISQRSSQGCHHNERFRNGRSGDENGEHETSDRGKMARQGEGKSSIIGSMACDVRHVVGRLEGHDVFI